MTHAPDLMFVGGAWTPAIGGGVWPLVDPGRGEAFAEVAYGDARDAQAALDAAAGAFPAWSARTAYDRAALLERAADLIASRVDVYARRTTEDHESENFVQPRIADGERPCSSQHSVGMCWQTG
jgi:acyl-CoA reductase-like NAD-dependent aldehyde dehydrogenase